MKREIKTILPNNFKEQNLLTYLTARFTYRNFEQWQNEIEEKRLIINNTPATISTTLNANDELIYLFKEQEEPSINPEYEIIYEDENLLVINKPANLPVHPAGCYFQNTLWSLLKKKYEKIYPVNRLDRDTSGLMIVAKQAKIQTQIEITQKKYLALVHGELKNTIHAEGFLFKNSKSLIRKKREFSFEKPENCEYETSNTLIVPQKTDNNFSLVEATLYTGRTHQIRATLFSLGYPVVGDKIYGLDDNFFLKLLNDELNDEDKKRLILDFQALHSATVTFIHPESKKLLEFTAKNPISWQQIIAIP